MKKQCSHCQKTFESRRNDAKFCSNGCRTNAHRAKNGIEKPAFLSNQKESNPPQKSVLSGVESPKATKLEYRQVVTPEWLEMNEKTNFWRKKHDELLQERAKAMEKYNRAVKSNNRLATTILGAGLGAGAASFGEEKPKTENVAWGAAAGAFIGFFFGQEETTWIFKEN